MAVIRAIGTGIGFIFDVVAFVVHLVLCIPVLGGILRTVLNWATELVWRVIGLIDFLLSLAGVRWTQKMRIGLLIPKNGGTPVSTEAAMMPLIDKAKDVFRRDAGIEVVYAGSSDSPFDAPSSALNTSCGASGFFGDWWIAGSFRELASAIGKFKGGWRRVIGYGGEFIVMPIVNVEPDTATELTDGCSFGSTHNYVLVEPTSPAARAAHEIGHSCWLMHSDDTANVMWPSDLAADPTLTNWQASVVRWSKHVTYL
jgi:hypothetical protein